MLIATCVNSEYSQFGEVVLNMCKYCCAIVTDCAACTQDEECLRPGDASDTTFLEKLEDTVGGHPHFVTYVCFSFMSLAQI